jgi:putative Ig domain-containing protein
MRHGNLIGKLFYAVTLSCISVLGLTDCLHQDNSGALTINTSSLPDGTVNQPYSTSVSGSGGTTPYTWAVTPALPANLSLDGTTGAITGTPVTAGTSSLTFTLIDSSKPQQVVQKSVTLTINPTPAPLSITTTSLPAGTVGQAYNQPVHAIGGTGPLTWSIVVGTLPQNLGINPMTGVISGTPTAAGTSSFTVQVTDSGGQADIQALSITINSPTPPTITSTSPLPAGTVSVPYSLQLTATGGFGTLAWTFTGSLPVNLTLSSTGTISGTPTNTGTSNFTVKVTDQLSQSATKAFSLTINAAPPPLTITTTSPLPAAQVGHAYNTTLQRSGGVSPFVWSVSPPLPMGLSLDPPTGKISGTPAAGTAGTYSNLNFTVQDSSIPVSQSASKVLSLTINP